MDLYFKRHDGQAVTCDDFLAAMADANGQDLSTVARWSVPMFARANPNQHAFVGNSWCKGLISLECVEPGSTHYSVLCCKSSGSSAIHIRLHVFVFSNHIWPLGAASRFLLMQKPYAAAHVVLSIPSRVTSCDIVQA